MVVLRHVFYCKRRACFTTRIRQRRWSWHDIWVFLVRIRSMTCANFLVTCVRCRIQFSIEWCEFWGGSSSKIWSLGRKTRFSTHFLYIKILYFLFGFVLWSVLSLTIVVLGPEFNSLSNDVSFEGVFGGKKSVHPNPHSHTPVCSLTLTLVLVVNNNGDQLNKY